MLPALTTTERAERGLSDLVAAARQASAANLSRAASVVGSRPMVENISTLMEPPASDRSEVEWISSLIDGASDERRYLDDHLHDVPDPVYDLLVEVGARVRRPLTVILERDGGDENVE